jgi:hypothetical protein
MMDPGDLDPAAVALAVRAAAAMAYEISSVTVLQHTQSRQWYVIEAN